MRLYLFLDFAEKENFYEKYLYFLLCGFLFAMLSSLKSFFLAASLLLTPSSSSPTENRSLSELETIISSLQPRTRGGALYLCPVRDMKNVDINLLKSKIEIIYQNINVEFSELRILKPREFPALRGLDMLIYFIPMKDAVTSGLNKDSDGSLIFGRYGIGFTGLDSYLKYNQREYEDARKLINHPYDLITSVNNTGFVIINPACLNPLEDTLRTAVHEIGHGLGAAHLMEMTGSPRMGVRHNVSDSPFFYMTWSRCTNPSFYETTPVFDSVNITNMRVFIENVVKGKLSKEETIRLRAQNLITPLLIP